MLNRMDGRSSKREREHTSTVFCIVRGEGVMDIGLTSTQPLASPKPMPATFAGKSMIANTSPLTHCFVTE